MKTLRLLGLAAFSVFLLAASCKSTKPGAGSDTSFLNTPTNPGDSLFAYLERGACFGRCPVYRIKVFNSGFVLYDAIKWTPQEGLFSTRLSTDEMRSIAEEAKRIGYFEMDDVYDNTGVSDLAANITKVNAYGHVKKIKNRYNGPAELRSFERFIDSVFVNTEWKPWREESQH